MKVSKVESWRIKLVVWLASNPPQESRGNDFCTPAGWRLRFKLKVRRARRPDRTLRSLHLGCLLMLLLLTPLLLLLLLLLLVPALPIVSDYNIITTMSNTNFAKGASLEVARRVRDSLCSFAVSLFRRHERSSLLLGRRTIAIALPAKSVPSKIKDVLPVILSCSSN